MIKISNCVDDYLNIQGVNSVVDQFFLHKDILLKNGIEVNSVYDWKGKYTRVPERKRKNSKNSITTLYKRSIISKSLFYECIALIREYFKYGKKAYKQIRTNSSNEDFLIFQNLHSAYLYLKCKSDSKSKVLFMTHMYKDYLDQVFINRPHIKGTTIEKILRKEQNYVFNSCNGIIVICEKAGDAVRKYSINNNIFILYNTVSVDELILSPGTHKKINIAVASSITKRKGFDIFIDALCMMDKQQLEQFEFHIYGNGNYFETFKKKLEKEKISNVYLYGNTEKPYQYYRDIDVVFLPSRDETLPMSILEGMALGLPILATNVGAVDELVYNGQNGILVDPNPKSILNGFLKLLSSKDKLSRWGEKSKAIFYEKFSDDIWVSQLSNIIFNIKGRK